MPQLFLYDLKANYSFQALLKRFAKALRTPFVKFNNVEKIIDFFLVRLI